MKDTTQKAGSGTPFNVIISSILSQVITGHDEEVKRSITEFLQSFHVTNEDGLSLRIKNH